MRTVRRQKGFLLAPPHRHRANGRLGIWYGAPFQSTNVTSSPSTRYGPFCLILIVVIARSRLSTIDYRPSTIDYLPHLLHGRQELGVALGLAHLVQQQLHGLDR